nr:activating signal cointegrator 1 complex subunit 2 homolog [Drosophila kikkawai]
MGLLRRWKQQFGLNYQAVNICRGKDMKSVIILLALVAFCQAAPLDTKESSTPETSTVGVGPISPDVISEPKPTEGKVVLLRDSPLNRQKRDEHKKPDSVKAREGLQHNPHRQPVEPPKPHSVQAAPVKPDSVKAHEGHNPHKREAHHEPGHEEQPQKEELPVAQTLPTAAPAVELAKKEKRETEEKPDSVKTKDSLAHIEHPATLQADSVKPPTEEHPAEKKAKREAHHEEGHQEQPQKEDLPVPHALPAAAPAVDLAKKQEKRETQEKPDSDHAKEAKVGTADVHDVVKALSGLHPVSDLTKKQEKRDIPVPTQTKATAEPAGTTKSEGGSTTPSAPHFKRPVPVDVLLHQKHDEKSTSSSEESKESKEKVKA